MRFPRLRAIATALILSSATIGVAVLGSSSTVEAAARPQVGNLLKQAISMAQAGNISGAQAKLRDAESVGGLTAGDNQAIAQVRAFVEAKSPNSATGSLAKFDNDYNAGRYSSVVGEDVDLLRKAGKYGYDQEVVVAQAYYLMGRCQQAISMLEGLAGAHASESVLSVLYSAAYKCGDNNAMRAALERLVQISNKPQYWSDLIQSAQSAKGIRDHQLLNLYRLAVLANSLKTKEDYETAAELMIEFHSAAEAQAIIQKGLDAKILSGDRDMRLLNTAKTQAAADAAALPKTVAAANAAKAPGDLLVELGELYRSMGRYPDAINAIQAGIKKGVTDKDDSQILLGITYFNAGQKNEALAALNEVAKSDEGNGLVAHLWNLYIRTH